MVQNAQVFGDFFPCSPFVGTHCTPGTEDANMRMATMISGSHHGDASTFLVITSTVLASEELPAYLLVELRVLTSSSSSLEQRREGQVKNFQTRQREENTKRDGVQKQ